MRSYCTATFYSCIPNFLVEVYPEVNYFLKACIFNGNISAIIETLFQVHFFPTLQTSANNCFSEVSQEPNDINFTILKVTKNNFLNNEFQNIK